MTSRSSSLKPSSASPDSSVSSSASSVASNHQKKGSGGKGWLSSLFQSISVSLGGKDASSDSNTTTDHSVNPTDDDARGTSASSLSAATAQKSGGGGGSSSSRRSSKARSIASIHSDEGSNSGVKQKQPAAAPSSSTTASKRTSLAAVPDPSSNSSTSMKSSSHKPKPAHKGVKWDEKKVEEQQKEAEQRHAQPPQAPYANFATPEDWKKPAIAAYPYMNRYRLIGKMGEGAFSTVYRAVDSKTNLLVALKLVSKNQLNDTQRNNILREASLLRRIVHGNVIRLVDFHETPLHYALALELMSGGEIFHQLVSQVCFSEPVCRHVIRQVAEGLRYLHEELGVVHRDIKLENLLFEPLPPNPNPAPRPEGLDPNVEDDYVPGVGGAGIGLVKIADFGLSKVVFNATTKTPCGTVGYTAPEILNDQRYSKGVDMWALGCVLYTILSGFPPFFDDDPRGLTEKVANGQYAFLSPWWDDISAEAKDLICQLLQVDPKRRYSIGQFLAHPWMQGEILGAPPAAPELKVQNPEVDNMDTVLDAKPVAKFGDWRDLDIPDVVGTPLDEYYTGAEGQTSPEYFVEPKDAAVPDTPARQAGAASDTTPAGGAPPAVTVGQGQRVQAPPKRDRVAAIVAQQTPGTPTYRARRTPHPVPDGITKEMLAAPYQVYQAIAEGDTRPEHIGMVHGGIVPKPNKTNPQRSSNLNPNVNHVTSTRVRAEKTAKRAGEGFQLEMGNSRLFNKRKAADGA
ncbi:hypothetical protein HKX48_004445 [Thoreauomyces humboldtii]|nr:hypothetical protein HKX48_004445 [Thoreauomyces humboldtii]